MGIDGNHSAGKHDRGFYTFYTIIPPLTIYPHLLFTPIYYYTPFTIFRALRLIGSRSEGLFLVQNILIQCQR